MFFWKNLPKGGTFFGLKFYINSIPNFWATFYVLGSPVDNDLNFGQNVGSSYSKDAHFVTQLWLLTFATVAHKMLIFGVASWTLRIAATPAYWKAGVPKLQSF